MAKTLPQLHRQIAALQRQADALKKKEVKDVIARIKEAIAFYELTPADLGLSGTARKTRKARKAPNGRRKGGKRSASPIKYRDESGHAWSGHGRRPQWFIDALASGKTAKDLAA